MADVRRRPGFTLAELMTVVAIIALLGVMVLPSLRGVFTTARRTLCANHLKRISESTQTWASRNQNWHLRALVTASWTGAVIQNAGGRQCLECPEGDELAEGTPVEDQIVIRTSPSSGVGIPLLPLLEGGGFKVLKLSTTQWNSGIAETARFEPVPYVPDGQPNVYWWGYDDGAIGSGDYDFQDLAIRVTKHPDGRATLFITGETAGKPEIWTTGLTKQLAAWSEINRYHNRGINGKEITLTVGGGSHYGMNNADLDMRMPGKIQALDYLDTIARSTDDWDNRDWDDDEDGRPDFLRHGGRLNVLFMDGSVKPMSRGDVDPVDVWIERRLWQP